MTSPLRFMILASDLPDPPATPPAPTTPPAQRPSQQQILLTLWGHQQPQPHLPEPSAPWQTHHIFVKDLAASRQLLAALIGDQNIGPQHASLARLRDIAQMFEFVASATTPVWRADTRDLLSSDQEFRDAVCDMAAQGWAGVVLCEREELDEWVAEIEEWAKEEWPDSGDDEDDGEENGGDRNEANGGGDEKWPDLGDEDGDGQEGGGSGGAFERGSEGGGGGPAADEKCSGESPAPDVGGSPGLRKAIDSVVG